jgi:hypothetical protein
LPPFITVSDDNIAERSPCITISLSNNMDSSLPLLILLAIFTAALLGYGAIYFARQRKKARLVNGRQRETPQAASGPICDMCSQPLDLTLAYFTVTDQVVTKPAYWEFVFNGQWAYVHRLDPYGDSIGKLAEKQASQSDTWALCGNCIHRLPIDTGRARAYAVAGTHPIPGAGPADSSRTAAAAAAAWKKLYGTFPSSIQFE